MSYQVFARKYRPRTFDEILGQDHVVQTLKNAISSKRIAQAYLFVGPRGTGKTTTARILSKALNCTLQGPRIDFDPDGDRNIQNRGKSGFVRIGWDEALDIVTREIKRAKAVGPGAIAVANGSHHQWGNLGHYLSAFNRFWNLIGVTRLVHSPDSWEGWFWGAMHHWGNSLRLGCPEFYGTVEDCLKEARPPRPRDRLGCLPARP